MKKIKWLFVAVFVFSSIAFAQEKLLTIEEIFGDAKTRVAFSGKPTFGMRWLVDGTSYFQMQPVGEGGQLGLYRIDAKTGSAALFYDAAKLEAALAAAGLKANEAKKLAGQTNFNFNRTQTAAILKLEQRFVFL
jgi:hypothetical protein